MAVRAPGRVIDKSGLHTQHLANEQGGKLFEGHDADTFVPAGHCAEGRNLREGFQLMDHQGVRREHTLIIDVLVYGRDVRTEMKQEPFSQEIRA